MCFRQHGFSLVELIAVIVIAGIIGGVGVRAAIQPNSFQLQASRDQIVAAFFISQQRAMAQTNPVRLSLAADGTIDIREDSDGDGSFADESSLSIAGQRFPQSILASQSLSAVNFDFNRLGQTTPATVTLSQGSDSVAITVSANGYIE